MNDIVIIAAKRTATGAFLGGLSGHSAASLGSIVIKALLKESGVAAEAIDQVVMGQVLTAGCGQNPARQAALRAGLAVAVNALTINKVCGSGLKAVHLAMQALALGEAEFVIAGGQESMSGAPHLLQNSRQGIRLGEGMLQDSVIADGLTDAFNHYHMGVTAENIAQRYNITRSMQDEYALLSHRRALKAQGDGFFSEEIVPVSGLTTKGESKIVSQDECPRHSSIEKLSALKPLFKQEGTVTAGNASPLNDGAAAVLMCRRETAEQRGLEILASVGAFTNSGIEPAMMGAAPLEAIEMNLKRMNWSPEQVDILESNEAFAAQALAVVHGCGVPAERINPHGGAIALGHAIGASGCRILVTLIHTMIRENRQRGMAALCIGGGEGVALSLVRR